MKLVRNVRSFMGEDWLRRSAWILLGSGILAFGLYNVHSISNITEGGALGLTLNLLKPNFSWTNETAVIKQSMTVLLTLVSGWGIVILLALAYYLLSAHIAPILFMLLSLILLAALTCGMLVWIKKRGTKIFAAL